MTSYIPYSQFLRGYDGDLEVIGTIIPSRSGPFKIGNTDELDAGSNTRFYNSVDQQSKISCPFCEDKLDGKINFYDQSRTSITEHIWAELTSCIKCGWWFVKKRLYLDDDLENIIRNGNDYWEGAISKFSVVPGESFISDVARELSDFRRSLSSISSREFEKTVGVILGNQFKCDVKHVGRSSEDGGIDLLLLLGDKISAVQVKHRMLQRKQLSEGVKEIRELVGAIFVNTEITEGVFVTSAPGFSRAAINYAKQVRERMPLNLVSSNDLKSMLGLMQTNQWEIRDEVWSKLNHTLSGNIRS